MWTHGNQASAVVRIVLQENLRDLNVREIREVHAVHA